MPTVFQRLNKAFGGNTSVPTPTSTNYTRNVHSYAGLGSNDVIYSTRSKEDYTQKLAQLRQERLLAKQWKRAQYETQNNALANMTEVQMMYREADMMDLFPEIGAALDIYMEEATYAKPDGMMINVTSKSERIKSILEDLIYNRLSANIMFPMITRSTVKYGNTFMLLNVTEDNGVIGWKQLPVYEMQRFENGMDNPYSSGFANVANIDVDSPDSTKFVWVGKNEFTPYRNWQIAHFRLLYDSLYLPYGCIVGDSRIETIDGYKEISNINIGDKVYTFNTNTQEKELATVTMKANKGVKDVYYVGTYHNYIEGTSDHKLLTYSNGELVYKEIKDLTTNDLLVIDNSFNKHNNVVKIDKTYPSQLEANHSKNMTWWDNCKYIPDAVDEEFAKFFGFMIGDGWIHENKVYFATGEYDSFNKEFYNILQKYTNKTPKFIKPFVNRSKKYEYCQVAVNSKTLSLIMKRMGFCGNFKQKRLPSWIYECGDSVKKAMLDGILISDGSMNIDKYGVLRNQIEMSNEQLIKDIKILAQSLGYKTSKVNTRNRVGKCSVLDDGYKIIAKEPSFYFYYYESYNKQEKKYDLNNRKQNGFKTEKIRTIKYVGKQETFDITVSNTNSNFFANGIVTHNCSALNKARRHWRMLSMMEDMMLMYRLERSVERRIYKVNVGGIDEQDVPAFMDEVANQFKRTPIIDPLTGQLDLRRNIMSQMDDYFLPIRDANDPTSIDNLAAGNNLTAMDDIKFVQNKLCTALRVPKSFLNFEDTTGDGKNLSLLDVRFTKTVNRVQQMMLMELTKVCIIHLYLLGFEDDLTNFSLTMNNPSSQAEMMELDNLSKKIEMAKSAVADPGGGLPLYSITRAQKEILGWSDKQISDNLEELRLEKALAAELEKTASIIKRTGLFDKVDNLYGEPGAEYGNNAGGQGQEDGMGGGAPGGGMAGGLDMGDDMGDDMSGEMPGAEGDMSMDDAAASEEADGGADNASEPLNEAFFNRLMQKTINEKKELNQKLMEKTKQYQNLLLNKINESKLQEEKELNVPLYTKNFLINEELNSIAKGLGKHINEKK